MIELFGWSDALHADFSRLACGLTPGRVVAQHRDLWHVIASDGEHSCRLSGRFQYAAAAGDFPVVGDWVGIELAGDLIQAVLPRRTAFARRAAGNQGVQVICANIDVALIVMSLNSDLNPRRLERYLTTAAESGAQGVCVLTKADLGADQDDARAALAASLGATPVIALSALTGEGLDALQPWLKPGETAVLLGSSGVGKSTLLNALIGADAMATSTIRTGDDRGRHTTRHRELFRLPNGALLIDAPGLRELGLSVGGDALDTSFADVTGLFEECRFRDCSHGEEPGCAVQAAIHNGALASERWRAYQKLQRETAFEERRGDPAAESAARQIWKQRSKNAKAKGRHDHRNAGWADDE